MKKVEKLKVGLISLTPTALVEKGRNHVEACTANPVITLPATFLTDLGTACTDLENANIAVRDNGGRQDTIQRTARAKVVADFIRSLAGYVTAQCQGDAVMIASTGFELQKSPQPIGVLVAPSNFRAARGKLAGELYLRWNGVHGKLNYSLQINSGDPSVEADWKWLLNTSRNSHNVTDLVSDKQYHFRVRANSVAGPGVLSDVATSKAA